MIFGVKSDKGKIREVNEDDYKIIHAVPEVPDSFIIADGMGGHNAGEVASKMAVQAAADLICNYKNRFSEGTDIKALIEDIMKETNTYVYNKSKQEEANSGMGTTLIITVFLNNKIYIGHIGDSRVYLIRENKIERITVDHSYVEEMLRNGSITIEEAKNHPQKNVITRALGCGEEIKIDTYSFDMLNNDYIVLCTDGLTNMIDDIKIKETVIQNDDLEGACEQLVYIANNNGGQDNITIMVIKNVG